MPWRIAAGRGRRSAIRAAAVTAGEYGAWTPIAAAELASGGYEVAWKNSSTRPIYGWATDADGNYRKRSHRRRGGGSQTADALAALFELPGAPSFTPIKTDGATSLDEADGEYVMLGANGFGPWLEYNGSPVTSGQFGAWTPIGAAELPAGGYEIAWKNAATGLYNVWHANADGDYVSSPTGGAVSGASLGLEVWSGASTRTSTATARSVRPPPSSRRSTQTARPPC